MSNSASYRYDFTQSRRNVAGLIALTLAAATWLGLIISAGRVWMGQAIPVDRPRVAAATEKIDPNTASVASLSRLKGIGQARAQAIVQYRRLHGPVAFTSPNDLTSVEGIGPATAAGISRDLNFPKPSQ